MIQPQANRIRLFFSKRIDNTFTTNREYQNSQPPVNLRTPDKFFPFSVPQSNSRVRLLLMLTWNPNMPPTNLSYSR